MAPLRILYRPDAGDVRRAETLLCTGLPHRNLLALPVLQSLAVRNKAIYHRAFETGDMKNIYWAITTLLQTSKFGGYPKAVNFQLRSLVSHRQLRCLATCVIFGRIQ